MDTRSPNSEVSFVLHGLGVDNSFVRAKAFGDKFNAFLKALTDADRAANGAVRHDYLIANLINGSAGCVLRERPKTRKPASSGMYELYHAMSAVNDGGNAVAMIPKNVLKSIETLAKGAGQDFTHGEVILDDQNIIRVDDFLYRRAESALSIVNEAAASTGRFYEGKASISYDGTLELIDTTGEVWKAKLSPTIGGVPIECIVNKNRLRLVTKHFRDRVNIEGMGFYEASSPIPKRVEITAISPIGSRRHLSEARGSMKSKQVLEIMSECDW